MRLAVTGAGGFVGRYVVERLRSRHEVLALSRELPGERLPDVVYAATDYSVASLQDCLEGMDGLVHLAAIRPKGDAEADVLANAHLDYQVLAGAERCALKRVVMTSTRGVYGVLPAPWHEDHMPAPVSSYALVKWHSELTADYFARRGLNVVTLRLAQVFGLGEYAGSAVATFIRKAYRDEPVVLTVSGILREYVYAKDVAAAIEVALNGGAGGVFNVGSEECPSLKQLALTIFRAFGREHQVSEAADVQGMHEHTLMDSSRFRREFDWAPAWTLQAAADDVAAVLRDERGAEMYGLSNR